MWRGWTVCVIPMTPKGAEGSMPQIFTLDSGPPTGVGGEAEGVGYVKFESRGKGSTKMWWFRGGLRNLWNQSLVQGVGLHGVSAKGAPGDKSSGVIWIQRFCLLEILLLLSALDPESNRDRDNKFLAPRMESIRGKRLTYSSSFVQSDDARLAKVSNTDFVWLRVGWWNNPEGPEFAVVWDTWSRDMRSLLQVKLVLRFQGFV